MRESVTVTTHPLFYSAIGRTTERVIWIEGQRLRDVIPAPWRDRPSAHVVRNGVHETDLDALVWSGDFVDVSERPAEPVSLATLGGLLSSASIAASIAVTLAGGAFLYGLIGRMKGPKKRGDKESATYSFGGASNEDQDGQPRQRLFGEMRVPGTTINQYVRHQNKPYVATLVTLRSLGVGRVTSIGGYDEDTPNATPLNDVDDTLPVGSQLNGDAIENFKAVNVHLRMGSQTQEPIVGHEEIYTEYAVGKALKQIETDASTNTDINADVDPTLVAYNADNGQPTAPESDAAQAVWDEFGVSIDTVHEHEAATAVISFPAGLTRYSTSGSDVELADAGFMLAIRYRRLTQDGRAIERGGDRGNGWVYIRPETIFLAHQQNPFSRAYSWTYADPQTYTGPTAGKALDCSTTGADAVTAALTGGAIPGSWATGQKPDALSLDLWVWFTGAASPGSGTTPRPIVNWWNGAATTGSGFGFGIEAVGYNNGSGGTVYLWVPVVYVGLNGSRINIIQTSAGGLPPSHNITQTGGISDKTHIVFTYEKNPTDVSGVAARYRLYVNGDLVKQFLSSSSSHQMAAPTVAAALQLSESTSTTNPWGAALSGRAWIDELRVLETAMTQRQVSESYNGGNGRFGASSSDLVMGYHFEATGSPSVDYGPNGNDLTLAGGATSGTAAGHVDSPGTQDSIVSRWRTQFLRLNLISNSTRIQDESVVDMLYGRISAHLAHPNLALVSTEAQATDQLSSSRPSQTDIVRGEACPYWDGKSLIAASTPKRWTRNPAWVFAQIAANPSSGSGEGVPIQRQDLPALKELADASDVKVYDGKGFRQTIDSSSSSQPISNITYDATGFGGLGALRIVFRVAQNFLPPMHWQVGGWVGFTGLPVANGTTVHQTLNTTHVDGLEIGEITIDSGTVAVDLIYDKTKYADPPFGGSGSFSTAINPTTLTGVAEGREPRFEFDACYDTFGDFWEVLRAVLSTCRAAPVPELGMLSVRYERARVPVTVISKANIIVDLDDDGNATSSFWCEAVTKRGVPNVIEGDIFDRDQGYKNVPIRVRGRTQQPNAPQAAVVVEHVSFFGITRRSQAIRWCKFALNAYEELRVKGGFRVGLDEISLTAGDVFVLANDLMPWGTSGHVVSAPAANQITLDRDVTIVSGHKIRVRVAAAGQTGSGSNAKDWMQVLSVSSSPGAFPKGTAITLSTNFVIPPDPGDSWHLYTDAQEFKAQVVAIRSLPNFVREVEWINYSDSVFDGVDDVEVEIPPGGSAFGATG